MIHPDGTVEAGPWVRQDGLLDAPLGRRRDRSRSSTATPDGGLLGSVGFEAATVEPCTLRQAADAASTQVSDAAAGDRMFNVRVPDLLPGTRSLVLREGATVLLTRNVSATSPTVAFTAPLAGATYVAGQSITATITAADADPGDTLSHTYAISNDAGATWRPLAVDVTGASLTFTAADDAVGTDVRLRVVTTDGVNTATADSASFTITAGAPAPDPRVVYVHGGTGAGVSGLRGYGLWTMNPDGTGQLPVRSPPGHSAASRRPRVVAGRHPARLRDRPGATQPDRTPMDRCRRPGRIGLRAAHVGLDAVRPPRYVQYGCPDWSPDGTRLSFIASHVYSYLVDGRYIQTIAADGTDLRTVVKLEDNGLEAAGRTHHQWPGLPALVTGRPLDRLRRQPPVRRHPGQAGGLVRTQPVHHPSRRHRAHPPLGPGRQRRLRQRRHHRLAPGRVTAPVHQHGADRRDVPEPDLVDALGRSAAGLLATWPAAAPAVPDFRYAPDGNHLYFTSFPAAGGTAFVDFVEMAFDGTETARVHAPEDAWNYASPTGSPRPPDRHRLLRRLRRPPRPQTPVDRTR